MGRWAFGLIVLAVAGCQGPTPVNTNPFGPYGPTQVPPPPTGTAGRTDPYYRRSLASQDAAGADRYARLPARQSRSTSDEFRGERPLMADRRAAADEGRNLGSRDRFGDADRSSYQTDGASDRLPEADLDWRRPDLSYRDNSRGVRSGMVRPRFVSSVDSFNTIPGEPAEFDRGIATTAGQLRPQAPLSGWTSQTPVASRPYNGWSR
ncbi:MAG: hypothetical protein KDB23_03185 [Planctomycetales bacterium]|nr:hypothetical protein [Planctomycetales bacterium]